MRSLEDEYRFSLQVRNLYCDLIDIHSDEVYYCMDDGMKHTEAKYVAGTISPKHFYAMSGSFSTDCTAFRSAITVAYH